MTGFARKLAKAVNRLKPTDWTPAAVPMRGAVDFQRQIEQRLDDFMFRNAAPIREIIRAPTDLYVAATMSNPALLLALMNNMYTYGRTHWKWVRGSPAGSQDPYEDAVKVHISSLEFPAQQRWKSGRGLLDGTVTSAVCGTFNSAFKFIAREIFDVPGIKVGTSDASTQIPEAFITLPGSTPIDSHWKGNVWFIAPGGDVAAGRRSNEQIRALRFKGHFFVNHNGTIYDVTGNKTYQSSNEMVWCYLELNAAKAKDFPGARSVFDVRVANASAGTPVGKYCVEMGEEPGDPDRFSNWVLTDRENLTAPEMKTLSTWSSCG